MRLIEYENLAKTNQIFLEEYENIFGEVLRCGRFILGEKVEEFEEQFARYIGSTYCVGVGSGLDALTISLRSLSLEPGSEILVPSNTYIATILAIVNCGLKPVLVEPDMRTYNIDPNRIEACISQKSRGVLVVHLYGKPCAMERIEDICRQHNLKLVEDCAQSHGASYFGRRTGSFGDLGAFSFYPTKNLGALGDGGAITTNNKDYYEMILKLRNYGSSKKYYNEVLGYNSRLDEIQAAFLIVKLKYLDEINKHKRELARLYLEGLRDEYIKPYVEKNIEDVFHIFNIRTEKRNSLREYLLQRGVMTEVHYPVPPTKQKAMQGILDNFKCPLSEKIHDTTLSLPIAYFHKERQISKVISLANDFLSQT